MRINVAVPEAHVNAPVLNSALESVTRLNEALLESGTVPTFEDARKRYGIKWQPEPPGQEHFDHAGVVLGRKHGDCDDLAPWQAASLRHTGEDPEAEAVVYKSGPKRWHAVVRRGDGSMDDPSERAGMRKPKGHRGATVPTMTNGFDVVGGSYVVRPKIAMRPVKGGFQARADIPWHWREHMAEDAPGPLDYAMTTLHSAPVASTALVGALEGAVLLGHASGNVDPAHLQRLECLHAACSGVPLEELADTYGDEQAEAAAAIVGSFFGSLGRLVRKAVPFVSKAVSFIPGVGPIASTALDVADKLIPQGGGGGGRPAPAPGPAIVPAGAIPTGLTPGTFPAGARKICFPAYFE